MPIKTKENQTMISLQDALQLWRDTEGHYVVHLVLECHPPRLRNNTYVQYLCLNVYQGDGTQTPVRVGSPGLEYPSLDAHTYPIALVRLLTHVAAMLERQPKGETESEQHTLFRSA